MSLSKIWINRFLSLSFDVASWSKDPSTSVGAVAINDRKQVLSIGYNGLPRGSDDSDAILNNRPEKYKRIIHAEENCIYNATSSLENSTMFLTHSPCIPCVNRLKQNGISMVYFPRPSAGFLERFNLDDSLNELDSLGISYEIVEDFKYKNDQAQETIKDWVIDTFGQKLFDSKQERCLRLLEEVVELMQAEDISRTGVNNIVEYVYSKPYKGDRKSEATDVALTYLAYLSSRGYQYQDILSNGLNVIQNVTNEKLYASHDKKIAKGIAESRDEN